MTRAMAVGAIVAGALCLARVQAQPGGTLELQTKVLNTIGNAANQICSSVSMTGSNQNVELSSEARAALNTAIQNVAELGIWRAGYYQTGELNSALRQDLVKAINRNADCRLAVLNTLLERMLPEQASTRQATTGQATTGLATTGLATTGQASAAQASAAQSSTARPTTVAAGPTQATPPQSPGRPENFFPWPPPRASSMQTFTASLAGKPYNFKLLGDVDNFLTRALAEGGIEQISYFSLPDDPTGYGMATRVEQIDMHTGRPLAGTRRWEERAQLAADLSFFDTLRLTERPKGRYRSFVLIVSAKPTPDNPDESVTATLALARRWTGRGLRYLWPEIRKLRVTPAHHLSVRVYEFEHEDKGKARFIESSAWRASEHLAFDGIRLDRSK